MNTPVSSNIHKRQKSKHTFLWYFLLYFVISIVVMVSGGLMTIKYLSTDLPDLQELENIYDSQALSTIIYSADGKVLRTLAAEKRFWVRYKDIPQCMIDAITAIEDKRFFSHWGISFSDIFRAFRHDVATLSFQQGASTITQQLAKNLYFGTEKKIIRKLREIITAIQIERTYTKSEILEMYLNKIELANNTFGIQAASRLYFGKNATGLTVPEAALLAGIFQNPAIHNPRSQLESRRQSARNRRDIVLGLMAKNGKIPYHVANEEQSKPVLLADRIGSAWGEAPHFVEHVRRELYSKYGREFVLTSGLQVHTTLDSRLQKIAEDSLRAQLDYLQKNYADRQLHYKRPPGISDEQAFKDSLDQTVVQGALLAIDVRTGQILAMVGGAGYYGENQFNRVTQALRQAGSVFKPFVYTTALDNGWRCSDKIYDGEVFYENVDGQGTFWEPQNFTKEHKGWLSLRDGLKSSTNIISIKLMNDTDNRGVGAMNVVRYAQKMGITTIGRRDAVMSLAIGTAHIKLIDILPAFTIFPNHGIKTETFSINSILDKNGGMLFTQPNNEGSKSEVLDPAVASLMLTMLKSVTSEEGGTAYRTLKRKGLGDLPCCGKTGTGNEYKDAWFIGFTPYIACGIWIGFDSEESTLGGNAYGTGATAALPVWAGFMKGAMETLDYPKDDFTYKGITSLRICRANYLKATPSCPDSMTYTEYYLPGTELTESCHEHGSRRNEIPGSRYNPNNRKRRGF